MSAWKAFERACAALIGGFRFWANSGERVDVEGPWMIGQCKLVKTLSLNALTKLVEEMTFEQKPIDPATGQPKIGAVFVKCRRGCGQASEPMVCLSFTEFKRLMERHAKKEAA